MPVTGGLVLATKAACSSTATGREDANALSTTTNGTNIMTGIIAGNTSAAITIVTTIAGIAITIVSRFTFARSFADNDNGE